MKSILVFMLITLSQLAHASSDFHLKTVFKNQKNLNEFTTKMVSSHRFKSAKEVKAYLSEASQGNFTHDFLVNTPIVSEFIFELLNEPKAIGEFVGIFIKASELIYFSIGMVFSFILAHFLGDLQFHFRPFGVMRMLYFPIRIVAVNGFRLWLVGSLFGENLKPILNVYMHSLDTVKLDHQALFIFSSFLRDVISFVA